MIGLLKSALNVASFHHLEGMVSSVGGVRWKLNDALVNFMCLALVRLNLTLEAERGKCAAAGHEQ